MSDDPKRHMDGLLDRKSLARMSEAFSLLTDIYGRGGWGAVERGVVRWTDAPDEFHVRARLLDGEIKSLLNGPTVKDWARGRRDIALAFIRKGAEISKLGAVELMERRIVGRLRVFDMDEKGREAFSAFMADAVGILVSGPDNPDRAAVGRLCAETGVGRGKLEIIEAESRRKPQDYRNYLAGSFWIDMPPPAEDDVVANALLTALQVRSTRKLAMTFHKQGFYTALAVSAAAAGGMSADDIARRFHLKRSLVDDWSAGALQRLKSGGRPDGRSAQAISPAGPPAAEPAEQSPSEQRPASPKQEMFVSAILEDLPWVSVCLADDWRHDRQAVSTFLSRVQDGGPLAERRAKGRDILRSRKLRDALSVGRGLEEASMAAGVSVADAIVLLGRDLSEETASLSAALSAAMGVAVDVG